MKFVQQGVFDKGMKVLWLKSLLAPWCRRTVE